MVNIKNQKSKIKNQKSKIKNQTMERVMSDESAIGEMVWMDLTVGNASEVKGFYQNVIGWKSDAIAMNNGEYNDFSMNLASNNEAVTGICHAKGPNADMPAAWLPYFLVADINDSVEQVSGQGGELVTPIKSMGSDKYVVIKDPAGAMCALYQKNCQ